MTPDETECALLAETLFTVARLHGVRGIEVVWIDADGGHYMQAGCCARDCDAEAAAVATLAQVRPVGGVQ